MKRDKRAFTLIEVLCVVVIIAILAAMIMGVGAYARDRAMRVRANSQVKLMLGTISEYKVKYGGIPPILNSNFVSMLPEGFTYSSNGLPADPWKQEYQYRVSGDSYRIFSMGPDMATGVTNSGDDI